MVLGSQQRCNDLDDEWVSVDRPECGLEDWEGVSQRLRIMGTRARVDMIKCLRCGIAAEALAGSFLLALVQDGSR